MRSAFFALVVSLFLLAGYCVATTPDVEASPAGVAQVQPTSYTYASKPPNFGTDAGPLGWWVANTERNGLTSTGRGATTTAFWANQGNTPTKAFPCATSFGSITYGTVAGWSAIAFSGDGGAPCDLNVGSTAFVSTTAWTLSCAWQYTGVRSWAGDTSTGSVGFLGNPQLMGDDQNNFRMWVTAGPDASPTEVITGAWNFTSAYKNVWQASSAGGLYLPHVTTASLYSNVMHVALDGNTASTMTSGTTGAGTGNFMFIGAHTAGLPTTFAVAPFVGSIAECVAYNSGSATLFGQVQSYMTTKYVGTGRDN